MTNFLQTTFNGILTSGVYIAVTLGLALAFGIMRIINFAHGELVMIGAYITYWMFILFGINPYVSLILDAGIVFLIGILMHKLAIEKILDAPSIDQVLLTFGFSVLFQNIALILWTANPLALSRETVSVKIGNIQFGKDRLIVFIIGVAIALVLSFILSKTKIGKTLNAVSQNRTASYLIGINVPLFYTIAFGISAALAGIAGGLISTVMYTSPYVGARLGLRAFAILTLAGLGNVNMTLIASLILGLSESYISVYVPQGPGWAEGVSFLIILIVLAVRPSGLKGMRAE